MDIVDTMLEQHAVEKLFPAPDDKRACRAKADPWYEKQRDDFLDQWEEEECPTLRDVNRWFYCRMCDLQIHVIHDPAHLQAKGHRPIPPVVVLLLQGRARSH
jgi:hypothetical protein